MHVYGGDGNENRKYNTVESKTHIPLGAGGSILARSIIQTLAVPHRSTLRLVLELSSRRRSRTVQLLLLLEFSHQECGKILYDGHMEEEGRCWEKT